MACYEFRIKVVRVIAYKLASHQNDYLCKNNIRKEHIMAKKEEKTKQKNEKKINPGWIYSLKTQGKIRLAPGFSFDSDSKLKLYETDA